MRKLFILLLFASNALFNSLCAEAYLEPHLGINALGIDNVSDSDIKYRLGTSIGLTGGYEFLNHISIEEEVFFRYNRFNCIESEGYSFNGKGFFRSYGFLTNALWTFEPFNLADFTSVYVGFGVGYVFSKEEIQLFPIRHEGSVYTFPKGYYRESRPCLQGKVGIEMKYIRKYKYSFEYSYLIYSSTLSNHTFTYKIKRYL
jgi:hypothetical protein